MRPSPDDILTALELMAARVPDRHITPDVPMAASWHSDLDRFDRLAIFRAAREWGGLRFPATPEFVEAVKEATKTIAAEEVAAYAAGELEIGGCTEGCDQGWILSDADHPAGGTVLAVRPCELCQPVAHAVWRHSIAIPDHDPNRCRDCGLVRSGKEPQPAWICDARDQQTRAQARRRMAEQQF